MEGENQEIEMKNDRRIWTVDPRLRVKECECISRSCNSRFVCCVNR